MVGTYVELTSLSSKAGDALGDALEDVAMDRRFARVNGTGDSEAIVDISGILLGLYLLERFSERTLEFERSSIGGVAPLQTTIFDCANNEVADIIGGY